MISNAICVVSDGTAALRTSICTGSSQSIDAKAAEISAFVKPATSAREDLRQRTTAVWYEGSRGLGGRSRVAELVDYDEGAAGLESPRQRRDSPSDILDVMHDLRGDLEVEALAV